nr:hypothetical protein [uncultured Bosea sp.]
MVTRVGRLLRQETVIAASARQYPHAIESGGETPERDGEWCSRAIIGRRFDLQRSAGPRGQHGRRIEADGDQTAARQARAESHRLRRQFLVDLEANIASVCPAIGNSATMFVRMRERER